MISVGYMAKNIPTRPEWLKAPQVIDIYSVSSCVNGDFVDYVKFWKHNGWWFFDSPHAIQALARQQSIDLQNKLLFYYEVYEFEFDEGDWRPFSPWEGSWNDSDGVVTAQHKRLEGYDVVTFWGENSPAPEHSPLSCNSLAVEINTNFHCLFATFEEAQTAVTSGKFTDGEPGALRIFAVYTVDWPTDTSAG